MGMQGEQKHLQCDFTGPAVGALIPTHPKCIHQVLSQPEGHHLRDGQGQPLQTQQRLHKVHGLLAVAVQKRKQQA